MKLRLPFRRSAPNRPGTDFAAPYDPYTRPHTTWFWA